MAATPDDRPTRAAQPETVRTNVPTRAGPDPLARRESVRQQLSRPRLGRRAPLALAAAVNTSWAALVSAAPVVAVVALTQLIDAPRVSFGGALRYGLAGWLLAHGVPLRTGIGPVGLVPLAVSAFALWRVGRAGVHTTRAIGRRNSRSPRHALTVALIIGLWYGVIGALAAVTADGPGLAVSAIRAALTLGGLGLVAGLAGALAATGAAAILAGRVPAVVRDGLRTGLVAGLLVLGSGAALAGLAVALAGGDAEETLAAYRTGVAGQAGITLLCLAYAPNMATWAASYLLGPGFAVGMDTVVRVSDVMVGPLPALPVLAGLPAEALPGAGGLLVGAPLAAGMVAGWLLARRRLRETRSVRAAIGWPGLLAGAALAGPIAGGVLGLAALASGGSLGSGRLSVIGPVAWQVAAVTTAVLGAGALVGAAATWVAGRSA